ncbi:MAG: hypothetical protein HQL24_04505 [Candidatus Omnitrophica bacterium]|nr:hypothetical protein [Candidatus Omnitrophota bacterium]
MLNKLKQDKRFNQTKFSFGATSAIITILGLITGLDSLTHPKSSIFAGILVIALADNISDSMGIHIYQESEHLNEKEVWISTLTNFLTRLGVSLSFLFLIAVLPLSLAVPCSVVWGLTLLASISYIIAKDRNKNPFLAIVEHLSIAIFVIILSHLVGRWVISKV